MRILLTNDDGIHAPGLSALYRELKGDFELDVVAPETEMSAVGHAITLTSPLKVRRVYRNGTFFGHSVAGTPADCVKIAVQELTERIPDMIISGINLGANVGVNVLYSGTVSAATEGAFFGIRSAAVSLDSRERPDFRFAARFCRTVIRFMMEKGLKKGTALNVNIPAVPAHEITGVSLARQGLVRVKERYERQIDSWGNVCYRLSGWTAMEEDMADVDVNVLKGNKITITPIHYDLTCVEELERLRSHPWPDVKHGDVDDE